MKLIYLTPENTGMTPDELAELTREEIIEIERDLLELRPNQLTPTQQAEIDALPDTDFSL